jgi:hypothetical protein
VNANLLKRWIVGKPMSLAQASHERLSKIIALPVFSSDALSSVAYATEEILLILAGAAATHLIRVMQERVMFGAIFEPAILHGVGPR